MPPNRRRRCAAAVWLLLLILEFGASLEGLTGEFAFVLPTLQATVTGRVAGVERLEHPQRGALALLDIWVAGRSQARLARLAALVQRTLDQVAPGTFTAEWTKGHPCRPR